MIKCKRPWHKETLDNNIENAYGQLRSKLNGPDCRGIVAAGTPADRPAAPGPTPAAEPLPWDDNGNGRISCAEARAHGIAPVRRGHPAYRYMRDGDGDGVVCE